MSETPMADCIKIMGEHMETYETQTKLEKIRTWVIVGIVGIAIHLTWAALGFPRSDLKGD